MIAHQLPGSLQSTPFHEQHPNQQLNIEIPLNNPHEDDDEITPSPVAGDDGSDSFFRALVSDGCRSPGRVESNTNFMIGGIGFSLEDPEITTNFRDLLNRIFGNKWANKSFEVHYHEYRAAESADDWICEIIKLF